MASDDMTVNQQATLKGSGSAGTITIEPSENEATNDSRAARKIAER
jgi:hypothetical protein